MNYKCPYCKISQNISYKPPVHCPKCGSVMIQQKESFAKTGCLIIIGMIFLSLVLAHFAGDVNSTSSQNQTAVKQQQPKKQRGDEDFRSDFVSSRTGAVWPVTDEIKKMMNDPKSFEHVSTKITPMKDVHGWYHVSTTFRGKNAFGGLVLNTVEMYINVNGVVSIAKPQP